MIVGFSFSRTSVTRYTLITNGNKDDIKLIQLNGEILRRLNERQIEYSSLEWET